MSLWFPRFSRTLLIGLIAVFYRRCTRYRNARQAGDKHFLGLFVAPQGRSVAVEGLSLRACTLHSPFSGAASAPYPTAKLGGFPRKQRKRKGWAR